MKLWEKTPYKIEKGILLQTNKFYSNYGLTGSGIAKS